jgi:hypothetical protein
VNEAPELNVHVNGFQNCSSPGWRSIKDILDLLSGPSFEELQHIPHHLHRGRQDEEEDEGFGTGNGCKRTLVVFVGGCTFAEIAALRFLSQQEDATTEYLVATTAIINGDKLIESMMTNLNDPLGF